MLEIAVPLINSIVSQVSQPAVDLSGLLVGGTAGGSAATLYVIWKLGERVIGTNKERKEDPRDIALKEIVEHMKRSNEIQESTARSVDKVGEHILSLHESQREHLAMLSTMVARVDEKLNSTMREITKT